MYTLVSAIAKSRSGGRRWTEVSIGDVGLNELFSTYSKIIATLNNNFLTGPVSLDLDTIKAEYSGRTITFSQFLTQNGNKALQTTEGATAINTKTALYSNAFRSGYSVDLVSPDAGADTPLPRSDRPWLSLTRPNTDYQEFVDHCLVNVNGFYHFVDGGAGGIFVQDGGKTCDYSKENNIGILSFLNVGPITCLKITDDMIYKQNINQKLGERVRLDLGMDISNKVVMLVLGGYLHVYDPKTFWRINDTCMVIDMGRLPLIDRFYESWKTIDLSSLNLDFNSNNPSQFAVEQFYSDDVIRAYLKLSQSFVVILDTPDIFVERSYVEVTTLPDIFVASEPPKWPLVVGYGKHTNYWQTGSGPWDPRWTIYSRNTLKKNYLYHTTDARDEISVSAELDPAKIANHSKAFFLKIGRDV